MFCVAGGKLTKLVTATATKEDCIPARVVHHLGDFDEILPTERRSKKIQKKWKSRKRTDDLIQMPT